MLYCKPSEPWKCCYFFLSSLKKRAMFLPSNCHFMEHTHVIRNAQALFIHGIPCLPMHYYSKNLLNRSCRKNRFVWWITFCGKWHTACRINIIYNKGPCSRSRDKSCLPSYPRSFTCENLGQTQLLVLVIIQEVFSSVCCVKKRSFIQRDS